MYVVVRLTNFDDSRMAKLFQHKEDAEYFLQWDWEDWFNDWADPLGGIEVDEDLSYHEDDYSILSAEDGDRVEWYIIPVEEGR